MGPAADVFLRRTEDGVGRLLPQFRKGTGYMDGHWAAAAGHVEADKSADLRWFDLAALPDPVVPHELQVMTAVREGTLQPVVIHGFGP